MKPELPDSVWREVTFLVADKVIDKLRLLVNNNTKQFVISQIGFNRFLTIEQIVKRIDQ